MVLSILLERPLVKQLDLADGPNFSDASPESIGVESPFRELPVKSGFEQVHPNDELRRQPGLACGEITQGEVRYVRGMPPSDCGSRWFSGL
jgi:hypothetical protein